MQLQRVRIAPKDFDNRHGAAYRSRLRAFRALLLGFADSRQVNMLTNDKEADKEVGFSA